ncbi:hypothetical protein [Cognaticolwellia beringensis]|uniref:Uncharacterized protein n=1 Tax=Cognaticolwellia beringensis TaxID=1967665 RepID=A0A222G7X7_9GAMM|nr:hypothetical protein [Cognaticolwellia beringensis]ASP47995.1 hypothetical protein B5D82_09630 [Cognaticolwellia beringensis]
MNKNFALLFSFSLLIMAGCSESDQAYNEVNDSELIKASAEINRQNFDDFPFHDVPEWRYDVAEYQGPYSESGEYYQEQNIIAPAALRNTVPIGQGDWLVAELYTRTEKPIVLDYIDVVPDPINAKNQVLKISTPDHTDGVVLRSKNPLPPKYRISLKIGFANYGNETKLNGYNDGTESAEPWRALSSVGHNGFYWLAILDSPPKPHNNIWIHHHRKFVIDSWNRKDFNHTVNVIALDGKSETHQAFGKKFISYVDGGWQKISDVPVDYYLPDEWYTVTFTRTALYYEYAIEGRFKNAGQTIYTDRIDYRKNCIYHYNQTPEELVPDCIDNRQQVFSGKNFTAWPSGSAYPEYFMFGEPHINYYEGSVLVDDITFEVL